jgi:hypothetical protein
MDFYLSFTFIDSSLNFLLFPNTPELHSFRTEGSKGATPAVGAISMKRRRVVLMFISISFIRLTLERSGIEKTLQPQVGTTQLKGPRLREIGGIRKAKPPRH